MINTSLASSVGPVDADTFLASGIHYGRNVSVLKAAVAPLALGIWQGFSVLNINKAVAALEAALSLMFEAVAQGGKVLFVCSSKLSPEAVGEWLAGAGQYYMARPVGGVLTN